MRIHEISESKNVLDNEVLGDTIVSGYKSLFDAIDKASNEEIHNIKKNLSSVYEKIGQAQSLEELYAAVQGVIFLPQVSNREEINLNLSKLSPDIVAGGNTAASTLAFHFIQFILLPKFDSLKNELKSYSDVKKAV